jgi:hypothetical protein
MTNAHRATGNLAAIAFVALWAGGCREHFYKQQVSFAYVFDIGSSKEITEWVLSQQEPKKILEGQLTLSAIPGLRSKSEAKDASAGYLRIHKKLLAGWPGLNVPSPRPGGGPDWSLDELLRNSRGRARLHAQNSKGVVRKELYEQIQRIDPNWMNE